LKRKVKKKGKYNMKKSKSERRLEKINGGPSSWQWYLSFIGQRMRHNYYLYYLIDMIFALNPGLRAVLEIGTGSGALTTVLGLWGLKLSIPVLSIDNRENLHDKKTFQTLGIIFFDRDQFEEDTQDEMSKFLAHGPVLLVCDGANKPWEFNTWVPRVPVGSVIGVHDWGVESTKENIGETAEKYCEEFMRDQWEKYNVQFAMFRRVR